MSNIQETIEGLPFYDQAVDLWNDYAGDHFQTKDPYREKLPNGKTRKRKLPDFCTKEDQKAFKRIQTKAWSHDKCFMGCYPVSGIGYAPIVSLIPAIGPLLMYAVHSRLIHYANDYYHFDAKTVAKMEANVLFDLLITLPPIIGSLFSFLNGCSTRNAAIIYNTVAKKAQKNIQKHSGSAPVSAAAPPVPAPLATPKNVRQKYQQQNGYEGQESGVYV